ncbi:MAG: SDR family oxidoreductase [Candidatus Omnitrophica bacterium]|nr:SDR family oxidoreductase [Candidatus Omnitrophota bacterium]
MNITLSNKIILITGGTSRLGRAFAAKAMQAGGRVIFTYYQNQKEAAELEKKGAEGYPVDLADTKQIDELAALLRNKIEHLDVLIHNAALIRDHTIQNMSEEDWDSVMAVNLRAPYYLTKKLFPLLFRKKSSRHSEPQRGEESKRDPSASPQPMTFIKSLMGSQGSPLGQDDVASKIFILTSRAAVTGGFGISNYAASKAGVIGLVKSLAQELGKKRILANAVNPGFMMSPMTENLPEEVIQKNRDLSPLARFSDPEEVAEFLIYLCSDLMTQVTGQVLHFESRKI